MSEYAHSRTKKSLQADALFDDSTFDAIDRIVDTRGVSYSEARRVLGTETPQYRPEVKTIDPTAGVSVELGARALALHNVMATFNQLNKTMGARMTSQYPNNEFDTRYRHPDEVRENMGRKAAGMIHDNKDDFSVLNATDELIAAGFDQDKVEWQERRLKSELIDKYGPGKAYAPERKKVVRKAEITAKRANHSKKKAA